MITAYVEGAGEVIARLDSLSDRLAAELRTSISRMTIELQNSVKRDFLSGQALGVKTGRLIRSIQQDVQTTGNSVSGVVSTNVLYGIGWETGWPGATPRQSLRAAKARFDLSDSADTFKNGTPKKRPFLVPALKAFEESGAIRDGIDAAIGRATQ